MYRSQGREGNSSVLTAGLAVLTDQMTFFFLTSGARLSHSSPSASLFGLVGTQRGVSSPPLRNTSLCGVTFAPGSMYYSSMLHSSQRPQAARSSLSLRLLQKHLWRRGVTEQSRAQQRCGFGMRGELLEQSSTFRGEVAGCCCCCCGSHTVTYVITSFQRCQLCYGCVLALETSGKPWPGPKGGLDLWAAAEQCRHKPSPSQ